MDETSDTDNFEQATMEEPMSWEGMELDPRLMELIRQAGFTKPTPVQERAIPAALDGYDLIVSAQTGTGKTAAFVFPLIERVKGREGTFAVVLAPSREIAQQTKAVMDQFAAPLGIRSAVLIGGIDMRVDAQAIKTYPQVIIATPGRLCDHIERGNLWLNYLEVLVLDEADRMLDMGFSVQLNRILIETPDTRQTLLYSATMPPAVEKLAQKILYKPERITIGKPVNPAQTVEQHFIFTDEETKLRELFHVLDNEPGTIFIFSRSKVGTAQLWRSLHRRGFTDATMLHSDLRQQDREKALQDFKDGRYRVIIATDVIGRGIHVDGVAHVVNYDFPRDAMDYVHRIGRTGRADAVGKATSFITRRDRAALKQVERLLGRPIVDTAHKVIGAPVRHKHSGSGGPSRSQHGRKRHR